MLHYMLNCTHFPIKISTSFSDAVPNNDLLYFEEMIALESELENFYYMPTLSREAWDGHTGYVHNLYEAICKKNNEACESIENLKPAAFYLCGWKFMIDDARQKIAALGYDKKSVHFELYG